MSDVRGVWCKGLGLCTIEVSVIVGEWITCVDCGTDWFWMVVDKSIEITSFESGTEASERNEWRGGRDSSQTDSPNRAENGGSVQFTGCSKKN